MLASFSLVRFSNLVMKELHLRWTGATLGPFLFLGLLKYHLLNFHAEEHLPVLWKSVYRFLQAHQKVVCRVPFLMSIAHWLHQIKFLPFNFHHRFLQWAHSTPRPRRSLSRRPRPLRWCWCVYWIVSRWYSATKSWSVLVQLSFSGSVDSRSSCLDCNCFPFF